MIVCTVVAFLLVSYSDVGLIVKNELTYGDVNFAKLSGFLGLDVRFINVEEGSFSDSELFDESGMMFKGLGISHSVLNSSYIDSTALTSLLKYLKSGGKLLIYEITSSQSTAKINYFIGDILDTVELIQSTGDEFYHITDGYPAITLEFTGLQVPFYQGHYDYVQKCFRLNERDIIISLDEYGVFTVYRIDSGLVFLDSGFQIHSLETTPFCQLYSQEYFSLIMPMLFFLKFTFGDECWHGFEDYANLTIDDPWLVQPFYCIDYFQLLCEMDEHNFHTTIAFIPKNFVYTQQEVAQLFAQRPDRYSIVQHGNNHDGREFYFPTQQQVDSMCEVLGGVWCDTTTHFPRPLSDQEADMLEGLTRLYEQESQFGIHFGKIMVFPWGLAPLVTLPLLKKCNYVATVNGQIVPLGEDFPTQWDYGSHPCEDYFSNFPLILRQHPCSAYNPHIFKKENWPFILYLDKPLLLYSHQHQIFGSGVDGFNPAADFINDSLWGEVKWASLETIANHLYWQKMNDDGSVQVWAWTNNVIITNLDSCRRLFHFVKHETQNIPINSVNLNNREVSYRINTDTLRVDFELDPEDSCEINIIYGDFSEDFALKQDQAGFFGLDTLFFWVFNVGINDGVCPYLVRVRNSAGYTLVALSITPCIMSGGSTLVVTPVQNLNAGETICIELDPYNVIYELNENNNSIRLVAQDVDWYLYKRLSDVEKNGNVNECIGAIEGPGGKAMVDSKNTIDFCLYDASGRFVKAGTFIQSFKERRKINERMFKGLKNGIYFLVAHHPGSRNYSVKKVLLLR